MTVPNPSVMARLKAKPVVKAIVVDVTPSQPAKGLVRPGFETVVHIDAHDGVIKAKHVKKGMKVRAYVHGKPSGGERVVDTVERSKDGSMVTISFSSPHPTTEYKAAYRFFVQTLVGTPVERVTQVPALVAYEEVKEGQWATSEPCQQVVDRGEIEDLARLAERRQQADSGAGR